MHVGKSIRHNIFFTLNVLDHIRKRFNKFTPFSMPFIQLGLTFKVLKCVMIDMYDKFMWANIMLPNMQYTHLSIQFFVIGGIIKWSTREFFTKI